MACFPTAERTQALLLETARRASASPCQRETPLCCGSAIRVFHAPPSRSVKRARVWYPLSATHAAGSSEEGGAPTRVRLRRAASKVPVIVVVSPWSAACTSAATTAPVSLHPGDPRLGIGARHPLLIRQPLARTLPAQADEVFRRRCLDAALLGHPLQHRAVALAGIPAHDRPQGRIGLHGGSIPDPQHARACRPDGLCRPTPMRSPRTSPRSAIKARTQPNTVSCTSWGRRLRVFDSQEWPGTRSVGSRRRNSRNENEAEEHDSIPRSLSIPSKYPTMCMRKYRPGGTEGAPMVLA